MVGLIIAFPGIVSTNTTKGPTIDADKVLMQMEKDAPGSETATPPSADASAPEGKEEKDDKEDPMKGLLESLKADQSKKP